MEVEGHPALLSIPTQEFAEYAGRLRETYLALAVIERLPAADKPGIASVIESKSLSDAVDFARSLMAGFNLAPYGTSLVEIACPGRGPVSDDTPGDGTMVLAAPENLPLPPETAPLKRALAYKCADGVGQLVAQSGLSEDGAVFGWRATFTLYQPRVPFAPYPLELISLPSGYQALHATLPEAHGLAVIQQPRTDSGPGVAVMAEAATLESAIRFVEVLLEDGAGQGR